MEKTDNKTIDELEKTLAEKRRALREFYFGVSGSKVKNVKAARGLRKEIARILTTIQTSLRSRK